MRRAIELAPTVADYYGDLGRLLDNADRVGEAIAVLRRGVERKRSGAQLATLLASILNWSGHTDEAVKVATDGLAALPAASRCSGSAGGRTSTSATTNASIADLTAANQGSRGRTDITPTNRALAFLWLSQAQYLAGRYPDALASARASERLVPGEFAAKVAADATDALRFEARADAIKNANLPPERRRRQGGSGDVSGCRESRTRTGVRTIRRGA